MPLFPDCIVCWKEFILLRITGLAPVQVLFSHILKIYCG